MELNPAPFLLCCTQILRMKDFMWKCFSQWRMSSVTGNRNCSSAAPGRSIIAERSTAFAPRMHYVVLISFHYLEVGCVFNYTYGCPSFTQSISASEWKVMGWGGGGWRKANSEGLHTQSKHYPMFELHAFSPTVLPHTRALTSESFSCSHPAMPVPAKYTAYPRKAPLTRAPVHGQQPFSGSADFP